LESGGSPGITRCESLDRRRTGAFDRRSSLRWLVASSVGAVIGWALWLEAFRRRRAQPD
jgi:hypothetical protein